MMKIFTIGLCLFFAGCASTAKIESSTSTKVENKPMPDWVNNRPLSNEYYIGIGYAAKKNFPSDFREAAKKNALNNLAGEISVTVSTSSVLSQLESDNKYKEDFQQDIRVTVNEQLQGFDEVDSYENKDFYWTYYRLSKADYQERKQKQVKDAVDQGMDFLIKARDYQNQLRYKEALLAYISGIGKISAYLDQSLETELSGQKIYLGNELFNGYRSLLNQIYIDAEVQVYRVKMGNPGTLKFFVKSSDGKTLMGIPLTVEVKKKFHSYLDLVSDANGALTIDVGKVARSTQSQYVTVQVNVKQLIKEAAVNAVVSKVLSTVSPSPETVNIEVQPVFVLIKSVEKNNGQVLSKNILDMALREGLAANGFIAVSAIEKADIIIEISADSNDGAVASEMNTQFYSSNLNVNIVFKKKSDGTEIYQRALNSIKGAQLSFEKASEDAYTKASKKMKLLVVDEFVKVYSE
ncbi:MAG: LPP20 family lipoprotein [Bacteroidetes bacterium]|nr:LPP20 family lipoprotein [Bacteroidota bacterium]